MKAFLCYTFQENFCRVRCCVLRRDNIGGNTKMSGVFPTRGQQPGFRGFGIQRDVRGVDLRSTNRLQLPEIRSTDPPPGHWPGQGGGIAYDLDTQRPYYSDGFVWLPIGAGAVGMVESYGFIKDTDQAVPRVTNTTVAPWEITSSDTYHTLPGWDLSSGVYTASREEILTLEVNLSWAAGVSNLGDRSLRIQHMKLGIPAWTTIKEVVTQADPDINVETTQECQMHAKISQGDAIRVTVEHDAPISVVVAGGVHTSISGFKLNQ